MGVETSSPPAALVRIEAKPSPPSARGGGVDGPAGVSGAERFGGDAAGLGRGEGVFELIEGDEDAHGGGG